MFDGGDDGDNDDGGGGGGGDDDGGDGGDVDDVYRWLTSGGIQHTAVSRAASSEGHGTVGGLLCDDDGELPLPSLCEDDGVDGFQGRGLGVRHRVLGFRGKAWSGFRGGAWGVRASWPQAVS